MTDELDSFVTKFRNLCLAGFQATLTCEAVDGKASVTLKAALGPIPPSFHGHGQHPGHQHRGPSYQRRQERRQAARKAAGQVPSSTGEVDDHPPPNDAALADEARYVSAAGEQADQASNLPVEDPTEEAEQADEEFPCQICDFVSNWQNGLKVHMTRKHENIAQVDGNTDSDDFGDKEYLETDRYWKTGILGTIFQTFLDASLIVERSDLSKDNKAVEKAKILEARKHAFGQHFRNYPPWK